MDRREQTFTAMSWGPADDHLFVPVRNSRRAQHIFHFLEKRGAGKWFRENFKSFQRHLILKAIIVNKATSCPFAFLQTACSGLAIKNLRGMSYFSDDRSKVSRRLGLIDGALACTTLAELNQELRIVIPVPAVAFFQPFIQPLVFHSHF